MTAATRPPLLEVQNLTKHFPIKKGLFGGVVGQVQAVNNVSFTLNTGETLGLVGESGCGKTTTGRCILRLIEPTSGGVRFDGNDVLSFSGEPLRRLRRDMQIIFQDPYSSLNPRMTVANIVGEGLRIHGLAAGAELRDRVAQLIERVGLKAAHLHRYPHEFSGGQRQRIGIARALTLNPRFIVCDEPVSALDVSIQAQILNLLAELQRERNLSYLFIAHDLAVVQHISDRVGVMYLGEMVEMAKSEDLYRAPKHPYTQALLSAIPVPNPAHQKERIILTGDVPTPVNPPSGCKFHTRCPQVKEICKQVNPGVTNISDGHWVRCHLYGESSAPAAGA